MSALVRAALLAAVFMIALPPSGRAGFFPQTESSLKADMVIVVKHQRVLYLLAQGQVLRAYPIMLGRAPLGNKIQQGDGRTPEGLYWIDRRNPESAYHRSLHISYPEPDDVDRARRLGVAPGGNIMIHGLPNGYILTSTRELHKDWTDGCIAMTNRDLDEIWATVEDGTPIEIEP